jgi:hypothetical protein
MIRRLADGLMLTRKTVGRTSRYIPGGQCRCGAAGATGLAVAAPARRRAKEKRFDIIKECRKRNHRPSSTFRWIYFQRNWEQHSHLPVRSKLPSTG